MEENKSPNKPKKPLYSKWWFWVIVVLFVIIIVPKGSGDTKSSSAGSQSSSTLASPKLSAAASTPKPAPTPKVKTYGNGQYKVGVDLPAGEYVLTSSSSAYFQISSDSTGTLSSILANDNFVNRSIVKLADGQYIKLSSCTMYAFADAPKVAPKDGVLPEGMYKIGIDIKPGEYKVIPNGNAYVEVSSSSNHTLNNIISNDNLKGEQYITVKDGQYLKISRATLKMN